MKAKDKYHFLLMLSFIAYIGILFYFRILAEAYGRTESHAEYRYNLKLFDTILLYVKYKNLVGMKAVIINILGNIAAFMPFGLLVPILRKKPVGAFLILLLSFDFSMLIEVMQLIFKVGSFDVDDLFLNTIGGLAGFICWKFGQRIAKQKVDR